MSLRVEFHHEWSMHDDPSYTVMDGSRAVAYSEIDSRQVRGHLCCDLPVLLTDPDKRSLLFQWCEQVVDRADGEGM